MANEEHVALLKQGWEVWNSWREKNPAIVPDLYRTNLSSVDLHNSNLSIAYLHDAELSGADLRGADLGDANLGDADLNSAELSGADLRGAKLRGAKLRGANLHSANLHRARLGSAYLLEVDLNSADLTGAILEDAELSGADLRGANLYGAKLRGAKLRGANLNSADLNRAILEGGNLEGANLKGAQLIDADLGHADLGHADLEGANLYGANLHGVNLEGANLGYANLSEATLIDSCLDGADLTGAKLWETQRDSWSIKGVVCQWAFWDRKGEEPQKYENGAFERIFAEKPRIILCYPGGISPIDLAMLPLIVERLQAEHPGCALHIRSVQDDGSGAAVTITIEDLADRSDETFAVEVDVLRRDLIDYQERWRLSEKNLLRIEAKYEELKENFNKVISMPKYIVGQAGAVGDNAQAQKMTFQQVWSQSGIDLTATRDLINDILKHRDELRGSLDAKRISILENELATLQAELAKPTPHDGIVGESLRSLRTVLEGATGNVLASGWLLALQGLT
jgi:uncharacterized protein YjbI with pentapeptide repeats